MTDTKLAVCFAAGIAMLAGASTASAQSPAPATQKIYVNANVGGQLASRTYGPGTFSQTVYEETASLETSTPIGTGPVFDIGAGYRVASNLFVGVTVSSFSTTSTATTTAQVPNPLFFNRFATVTGSASDLKHRETAILPQLVYSRALTDKIDVNLGVGPSIIRVSQDVVDNFTVPTGTQNTNLASSTVTKSGIGLHGTLDLVYNLAQHWGLGGYVRYAGAKVELPGIDDKVNVGGMQAGGGIRLRF